MTNAVTIPLAWRELESRYAGKCSECGTYIAAGERIGYNPGTKLVRCHSCQDWATWTARREENVSEIRTTKAKAAALLRTAGGIRKELAKRLEARRVEERRNKDRYWRDKTVDLSHGPKVARELQKCRWLLERARSLRVMDR